MTHYVKLVQGHSRVFLATTLLYDEIQKDKMDFGAHIYGAGSERNMLSPHLGSRSDSSSAIRFRMSQEMAHELAAHFTSNSSHASALYQALERFSRVTLPKDQHRSFSGLRKTIEEAPEGGEGKPEGDGGEEAAAEAAAGAEESP